VQNSDNMFNHLPPIILASISPRRKALLTEIGLSFMVEPSSVHEDFTIDLAPEDFAQHYAKQKAMDISYRNHDSLVIGADTIVVLGNRILGKPKNATESYDMLSSLSGTTHTVMTGVSLQAKSLEIDHTFIEKTKVQFKELSNIEINYYIENYEPFDKAGSYGIQDWFSVCVEKIEGCFYNVVGFPLSAFYKEIDNIFGT